MANVKNFGLVGVGSTVQYGKGGPTLSGTPLLGLSADGTAAFKLPVGTTAQQPAGAGGMIRANSDTNTLEYYNGSDWVTLATGGGTQVLQDEIDAIEAALGPAISVDGVFVPTAFTGAAAGATSFTDAIQQVADAAAGLSTLEQIEPVVAAGNIIYADSATTWAQALPGVDSGVQPYDPAIDAFLANTTPGILVQGPAGTYNSRTLVAPDEGFTITDPDGVAGDPTFVLANDLAGLEALATTGYAIRTGDGTWKTGSIAGTAGNIVVDNGDGVTTDTVINLAPIVQAATGTLLKVEIGTFGRVIGNTPVAAADLTGLLDSIYVNVAGDTMEDGADLVFVGGGTVTGLPDPTNPSDAANMNYVDARVAGLSWKQPAVAATTAPLPPAIYDNGATGVGATLTASAPGALPVIDGITLAVGERLLVKNQAVPTDNGIYDVTDVGGAGPWILTRSADLDTAAEADNATVFVTDGTAQAGSGWTQTTDISLIGTQGLTFVQFTGAGTYAPGNGLSLAGNTFSVNMGAGITALPANEVGIDLVSGLALQLTDTTTAGQLTFVLDGGNGVSGLEQGATGLKIPALGVTNAMLTNSAILLNADANTGTVALGGTLEIHGTSAQGITTSLVQDGSVITITAADATTASKGVASFLAPDFAVTAGVVSIGTIPAGSIPGGGTITLTGDTMGPTPPYTIALGGTLDFAGDTVITTGVAANGSVTFTLGTVDVAHGGTGLDVLLPNAVLYGSADGTAIEQSDTFAFDSVTNTLTLGSATIQGEDAGDVTITATTPNGNINLLPDGTGAVVIGPSGAGVISSDPTFPLTVDGNTGLTLTGDVVDVTSDGAITISGSSVTITSTDGDVDFNLDADGAVLHINTPTDPLVYADAVTAADGNAIPNKEYVDAAIAAGGGATSAGAVKAVKGTINLATVGPQNIGLPIPLGSTILSVKVNVTAAAATGTLVVGGGAGVYMPATENDLQQVGLYLSETAIDEAAGGQVTATVTGGAAGSAGVLVEYQNATT